MRNLVSDPVTAALSSLFRQDVVTLTRTSATALFRGLYEAGVSDGCTREAESAKSVGDASASVGERPDDPQDSKESSSSNDRHAMDTPESGTPEEAAWQECIRQKAALWPSQDATHHDIEELITAGERMRVEIARERDRWMGSAAGYGSDAVEWKIRAEAAEAKVTALESQLAAVKAANRSYELAFHGLADSQVEVKRLTARLEEVEAERDKANRIIELVRAERDRYVPCPDHRDKTGHECPACYGERTERARQKVERDQLRGEVRKAEAELTHLREQQAQREQEREAAIWEAGWDAAAKRYVEAGTEPFPPDKDEDWVVYRTSREREKE